MSSAAQPSTKAWTECDQPQHEVQSTAHGSSARCPHVVSQQPLHYPGPPGPCHYHVPKSLGPRSVLGTTEDPLLQLYHRKQPMKCTQPTCLASQLIPFSKIPLLRLLRGFLASIRPLPPLSTPPLSTPPPGPTSSIIQLPIEVLTLV